MDTNLPLRSKIFQRMELAAGSEMMDRMASTRVILFGVGGVGSWAAETLVRSGVGSLTIVDSDDVAVSNINRQLPALTTTVGLPKVEVLSERLLQINPEAEIVAVKGVYSPDTADEFQLESYDYVLDAIDSLRCKAALIMHADGVGAKLYASMGAALKVTSQMIAVAEFGKVQGCPLARALRTRLKHDGQWPRHKFMCVYSPERLANRKEAAAEADEGDSWAKTKAAINGTFAHTTAIFGHTLAGLVVEDVYRSTM